MTIPRLPNKQFQFIILNTDLSKVHENDKDVHIMSLVKESYYTIEDIYNLPEGKRAELIDGQIYFMAPPTYRQIDFSELLETLDS